MWTFSADLDNRAQSVVPAGELRAGRVMGVPAMADVDRDGTADLIAEFAVLDDPTGLVTQPGTPARRRGQAEKVLSCRRIVAAVSGRSGKELWHRQIDREPVDLNEESLAHGVDYIFQPKGPFVAVVSGTSQMSLDPATGRVTTPALDLGFTPVGPIQYADLDGDGFMEVLALEPSKNPAAEPLIDPTLAAFSMARGKRLWARKLDAWYRPKPAVAVRDWPVAADLDNDGRAEVVVADYAHTPDTLGPYGYPRYSGIRMLDGATGEPRWDCPLWPVFSAFWTGLIHLLAAPDLDADGVRDVVVISRYSGERPYGSQPSQIYVNAVSGKGGQRLWRWHTELTNADTTPINSAFWWGLGSDGWPMLALPIGGKPATGGDPDYRWFPPDAPVVHLLAAATGIEEHTVAGLTSPKVADLTGDGLADLWGAVDGKLVAIRAEPAEAWRALDGLHAAADFDGDGTSDLLSDDIKAPPIWPMFSLDRHTALARSGRDGRLLWQTQLDTWEKRVHGTVRTREYRFMPLALPGGDLDGDGAADFVVRKWVAPPPGKSDDTLPLEALSGRTGKWLWATAISPSVGPRRLDGRDIVGIDAHACNRGGSPDVFLMYVLFMHLPVGPGTGPMAVDNQYRLARLSGRDGHVVWDVLLAEYQGGANQPVDFLHEIADLDGNGDHEIVVLLRAKAWVGMSSPELRVLSLTDGQTRWVHAFDPNAVGSPAFAVGDVDGNGRLDIVVSENPRAGASAVTEVTALLGQSGKPLWSWRGGTAGDERDDVPRLRVGNFDGTGPRDVCINFGIAPGRRRVAILDAQGHERSGRDLEASSLPGLWVADLDGDGRDEMLFHDGGFLRTCRRDLTELWSLPTREAIRELLPGAHGRAATVVINPSVGLGGATGRPKWTLGPARSILKTSDSSNLARALSGPDGTTICRVAMPASADGRYRATPGVTARPPLLDDDPRREQRLFWVRPNPIYNDPFIQVPIGATLVNVCIPLMVLRFATRRRFWSVRLLLALPMVVAVIMAGSSTLISLAPDDLLPSPTSWQAFVFGMALLSVSGLPIVAYTAALVLALVHRRWKKIGVLVAGAVLAAVLILTLMLLAVSHWKPAIEHFNWSGSHEAFFWGAYVAGLLMLVARALRSALRLVLSLARTFRRQRFKLT